MSERILFVDDEPNVLAGLRRQLHTRFNVETALGPEAGLEQIRSNGPYAVVVSDLRMPGIDGIQFLATAQSVSPETVRVMLTGCAEVEAAVAAVNEGAVFRFLVKPVDTEVLVQTLTAALQQYRLMTAERELLHKTLPETVRVLSTVLAISNPAAFSRATRASRIVRHMAGHLMVPNSWQFELAALLSQIGCIAVPNEILQKVENGQDLSIEEQRIYSRHPLVAHDLLVGIPRLDSVAKMIARQQESPESDRRRRRDGIDFGAQMLQLALDYDALVNGGMAPSDAVAQLRTETNKYDRIFLMALENLGESSEEQEISVNDLDEKMVLANPVQMKDGTMLLNTGEELSQPILNLLRSQAEKGEIEATVKVLAA